MLKFKNGTIPELEYKQAIKKLIPVRCIQINEFYGVETPEGIMKGKPGDWLMV